MLGRQEVRDFDKRLSTLEFEVAKLNSLENVVVKLEEVLTGTRDSVSHLNIFMERLEERNLNRDKWSRLVLGGVTLCVPLLAAASGYFVTSLVNKIDSLEKTAEAQNIVLTELSTKFNIKLKIVPTP